MWRVLKKVLLGMALFVGLAITLFLYAVLADQRRFHAAANPCERACVQDSGGLDDCRKHCASHPLTYGTASQAPIYALSTARIRAHLYRSGAARPILRNSDR
jgi:hypothetical protein